MAKRKDLLLKESTVSRMMGLAGIGALTNPFLREERSPIENQDHGSYGDQEEEMEEGLDEGEELDEGYGTEELDEMHDEEGMGYDALGHGDIDYDADDFRDFEDEEDMDSDEEEFDDEEELEEAKEPCKKCGEIHEGSSCSGYMQENIHKSMKRLKRLLEQAEGDVPPPAPEGDVPPPESAPGGDDQMESKIKDFVKKLGELVQETLGVEVTVEEGEGEPEMPPPAPEGGEAAPPAPMAEAINRLVNKVAARVKARLMEAKTPQKKEKGHATHNKTHSKFSKAMKLKEKQMAAKKKEKEEAAKKKEMEMKKKKAAMSKKK